MNETVKLVSDYGLIIVLLGGMILLFAKYIPKLMNVWIDRLQAKNAANDLLYERLRNSDAVIENNSRVIENNTQAMKKSSAHYDKINTALDNLNSSYCQHDKRAEDISKDILVIREKLNK